MALILFQEPTKIWYRGITAFRTLAPKIAGFHVEIWLSKADLVPEKLIMANYRKLRTNSTRMQDVPHLVFSTSRDFSYSNFQIKKQYSNSFKTRLNSFELYFRSSTWNRMNFRIPERTGLMTGHWTGVLDFQNHRSGMQAKRISWLFLDTIPTLSLLSTLFSVWKSETTWNQCF